MEYISYIIYNKEFGNILTKGFTESHLLQYLQIPENCEIMQYSNIEHIDIENNCIKNDEIVQKEINPTILENNTIKNIPLYSKVIINNEPTDNISEITFTEVGKYYIEIESQYMHKALFFLEIKEPSNG